MIVLAVGTLAVYLPMLYEKLFVQEVAKTHLLFSPVSKKFIYREKIVGDIPPESYATATDHKPQYAYRDQDGRWYTRVDFEKLLPFIYYKNMELWGLLPLKIDGEIFARETIKKNRQVWELKQTEIGGSILTEPLFPLLESKPGDIRLSFPKDRFRMTENRMEFVNVYSNKVDESVSTLFTNALKARGFEFPGRSIHGKFSILKPYDAGIFMVDNSYNVFHVKRKNGQSIVVKTPISSKLQTRHIKISEKKDRTYYGFLLDEAGKLYLISCDNYELIPLPLKKYDFKTMDFKLVVNPLYKTAIYSDDSMVYGLAMTPDCKPVARYQHRMSRANKTVIDSVHAALFPFSVRFDNSGKQNRLHISCKAGGWFSLVGICLSLLGIIVWNYARHRRIPRKRELCLVALTGIYGLIVLFFYRAG